ncbi:O-antigen ligase family protein [Candidatus Pelagibacter sp.]|uniref:O-antigen ligase family protein n=1 Tax=Candidatus Pelagibacter sp. TaxID=2024849 RepID=UPI003F86E66C
MFSLAVSFFLLKKPKIINYIFYLFVTIFIVLFFDSIYQYFFSKNIIGFEYINKTNFRVTSFFGKDEVLGSYIARFFPFLLFLILVNYDSNFSKKVNFFITTLTIVSFSIVLISGERTAIGLFILSFVFIYFSSQKFRKIFMVPLIGIIIVFIFAVSMSEKIKHRIVTTTLNQMGLNAGSERIVLFSKTYEGHYKIAANMFEEKPLIGHGAKMFRFYCSKDENYVAPNACTTHPHNFYAQMLAELGIIGFLTLLVLFFYITYFFLKNLYFQIFKDRQFISNESICLLGFYFMTLFPFLPSGNFFNNWLSIIIYYPLGFLIYIIKRGKFYA